MGELVNAPSNVATGHPPPALEASGLPRGVVDLRAVKGEKPPGGQITAILPNEHRFDTSGTIFLQKGKYNSAWLRVIAVLPSAKKKLEAALRVVEDETTEAAVWVTVPETDASLTPMLLERGFRFHHHVREFHEHAYYLWCGEEADRVPAYATAIQGLTVLLKAPDDHVSNPPAVPCAGLITPLP